MSETISINFLSRGLDQAKDAAKRIAGQVREASRALKDLAPEARRQFAARQRELAKERQDAIAAMRDRLRLERTYAKFSGRDLGASQDLRAAVAQGRGALGKARSAFGAVSSGNLAGGLSLLAGVPVVGQVAAGAAAVAALVMPYLERQLEARMQAIERASTIRQERAFFEADFARRFAEDPDFRDKLTREAVMSAQADGAAIRSGRLRRRGRFLGE